jgi:hypothetical protein
LSGGVAHLAPCTAPHFKGAIGTTPRPRADSRSPRPITSAEASPPRRGPKPPPPSRFRLFCPKHDTAVVSPRSEAAHSATSPSSPSRSRAPQHSLLPLPRRRPPPSAGRSPRRRAVWAPRLRARATSHAGPLPERWWAARTVQAATPAQWSGVAWTAYSAGRQGHGPHVGTELGPFTALCRGRIRPVALCCCFSYILNLTKSMQVQKFVQF